MSVLVSACGTPSTNFSGADRPPVTPTVTPLPSISLSSPILGGSWQAFDTLFGDSNCCLLNGWEYTGKLGAAWTGVVESNADNPLDAYQPNNPNSRVIGIQSSPNGPNWSMSQQQTAVNQFMPPDAKYISTKTVYIPSTSSATGIEKTYSSVLLARTLPKSDFMDVNGKQAQPGVFYVYLDDGYTDYEECRLGTDGHFVQTGE